MPVYADLRDYFDQNREVTHEQFARRVGATQPQISRIAAGQCCPRPALALKIAKAARIPLASFQLAKLRYERYRGRKAS